MIKRHSSELMQSTGMKLRMYERLWPNRIDQLKSGYNAENLGLYMNEALDLFFDCETNQQEKKEILKYLRQALAFGVANFMYANYTDKEFSFVVEGNEITLKGGTDGAYKHTSVWMKAMYIAIILRANNAVDELCKTSEEVFKNANIKANEFDLTMIKVLKGLFDAESDIKNLILHAFKLYDSDAVEEERREFISEITAPTLALYKCILTGDEKGFNEELENALQIHHDFWSQSTQKSDDRNGWISLPLLAASVLAFDNKDFNITIQSDYLPEWLYKKIK